MSSTPNPAKGRLQAVLRLLALEPEHIGVDSVRTIGRPAALARDFADYHTIAAVQSGAALTSAQRSSLERIAQQFATMAVGPPRLWGERAVLQDAEWEAVRAAAQVALLEFGWSPLHSDPRVVVEQARWLRCARAGLWLGPGSLAGLGLVCGVMSWASEDGGGIVTLLLAMLMLSGQVASAFACAQAGPAWKLRPVPLAVRALTAYWMLGPLLLLAVVAFAD